MKPCLLYANNSLPRQILHILCEVWEVVKELARGDYERAGEELADVQVSCETLLYILGYQSESERNRIRNKVDRKNALRGYHARCDLSNQARR